MVTDMASPIRKQLLIMAIVATPLLGVMAWLVWGQGKELGRYELAGDPKNGLTGTMPYPVGAKEIHVYYEAEWDGSSTAPEASIQLELVKDENVIETTRCATATDIGVRRCGRKATNHQDCEFRVACAFPAQGRDGLNVRAKITFSEPERFRQKPRFQVVFRD